MLMGFVVALVAYLMTFLSGLSAGLISNNVSGLKILPVTHFSFQFDDKPTFRGSLIDQTMWDGWAGKPGVLKSESMGHTSFNGRGQNNALPEFVLWGVRLTLLIALDVRAHPAGEVGQLRCLACGRCHIPRSCTVLARRRGPA